MRRAAPSRLRQARRRQSSRSARTAEGRSCGNMLQYCFDFLSRRSRSRLLLFYFRLQTKPRPAIIKVCFPLLIFYPAAHALASSFYFRLQTKPRPVIIDIERFLSRRSRSRLRRSRSRFLLFYFRPQTKSRPAIIFPAPSSGVTESLNGHPTPIACRGLVYVKGKGTG